MYFKVSGNQFFRLLAASLASNCCLLLLSFKLNLYVVHQFMYDVSDIHDFFKFLGFTQPRKSVVVVFSYY